MQKKETKIVYEHHYENKDVSLYNIDIECEMRDKEYYTLVLTIGGYDIRRIPCFRAETKAEAVQFAKGMLEGLILADEEYENNKA